MYLRLEIVRLTYHQSKNCIFMTVSKYVFEVFVFSSYFVLLRPSAHGAWAHLEMWGSTLSEVAAEPNSDRGWSFHSAPKERIWRRLTCLSDSLLELFD